MKGFLIVLLLCGIFSISAVSIFDIQYTTKPGSNNTYPSSYVGKTVTVEGIVTAINYSHGGFFISEPAGGPWRGIYIRTQSSSVKTGDKVILRGIVDEYFGMTCIQDVKAISVIDSNHPLPFANMVASGQITTPDQAEAYEGTLVKIQNATYVQNQSNSVRFSVNDGSGACLVSESFVLDKQAKYRSGEVFTSLTGIVCYAFGDYSINPRNRNDVTVMAPVFNQNRSWGKIKSIYK